MPTKNLTFISNIQNQKKKNILFKSLFHKILTIKYNLSTKKTILKYTYI